MIKYSENLQAASARASVSQKVLRRSIKLAFQDSPHLRAYTLGVSRAGLTMMSPLQIAYGKICKIEFNIMLDGEIRKINAVSKTNDCICVGTEGFRTGLRFLNIDVQSQQAINDWMNYHA